MSLCGSSATLTINLCPRVTVRAVAGCFFVPAPAARACQSFTFMLVIDGMGPAGIFRGVLTRSDELAGPRIKFEWRAEAPGGEIVCHWPVGAADRFFLEARPVGGGPALYEVVMTARADSIGSDDAPRG